ncbi:MAG TPA: lactonase family protein [Acidobacteriaceae bacterium]|nr:lactonase family protein [Acidobacteriaceae bacterium]
MMTRRRLLKTLPALAALPGLAMKAQWSGEAFTSHFHKKPLAPPQPTLVYFGTDTAKGVSKGIYVSRFDSATGQLTAPVLAAAGVRPGFLALSESVVSHPRLYVTNEALDASATISSFAVDLGTGALRPINQVSAGAPGPCFVSLDATGEMAFAADYAGSAIASYRVLADGSLSEPVERIDYKNAKFGRRGPVAARQDAPHPHSVHVSPDNRFLLVNDLGSDAISVFRIEPGAKLGEPVLFHTRPGSGPRHVAFHPNGRWVYSINELDSTIDHFLWTTTSSRTDPQAMLVNTGQTVKTGATAKSTGAAEVAISPDGNFLYASNRGEDTLVVFSIDDGGRLTLVERIACGGKTPRHFTLSPDSKWLLCGNQDSATVTVFRRDGATGRLGGPVQSLALDSVMFTLFA